MASPRMRPTFACPLTVAPESFCLALQLALQTADAGFRGQLFGAPRSGGAILRRLEQDQHFWSPALHLHMAEDASGRWSLHGRFSPSSPVWTAFVAIYLSLACLGTGAGCYGGAQMIMGNDPWALLGVPIAIVLAAFTYGAAFIGQGLGGEDMYALLRFVEDVVAATDAAARLAPCDAQ